jgi:leader peptidase (prepilin peptidase)/N-methyltransferase
MLLQYLIFFILGMIVGLFLNNCISHLPEGNPVFKFTSFGNPISARYILVLLLTGFMFAALYHRYSITMDLVFFAYLMSLLIVVFFIDIAYKIIPDELVIAGLAGSLAVIIFNAFKPLKIFGGGGWWTPLLGIFPGSGFLFLIAIIGMLIYKTDDAIGMGDVKIFAPIGIFLGWRMCIIALLISVTLAGLASIILLIFKLKKKKDAIPFGPFIVVGTFVTIMWGINIVGLYTSC